MAYGDDFWAQFKHEAMAKASSLSDFLSQEPDSMEELTDLGREKLSSKVKALSAGTRVKFQSGLSALMAYDNPPEPNAEGTIVLTRTSSGDTTHLNDLVFVKWDNGSFIPAWKAHLKPASKKTASSHSFRVSSLGDITDFLTVTGSDDLIHKATEDLWAVTRENGSYVISRLFDESGEPLKV